MLEGCTETTLHVSNATCICLFNRKQRIWWEQEWVFKGRGVREEVSETTLHRHWHVCLLLQGEAMCWMVQEQAFLHRGVSEETPHPCLGCASSSLCNTALGCCMLRAWFHPAPWEQAGVVPAVPLCTITATHLPSPDALWLLKATDEG